MPRQRCNCYRSFNGSLRTTANAYRPQALDGPPLGRPPRSAAACLSRRDYSWWLSVLGKWDAVDRDTGKQQVTIAVSGGLPEARQVRFIRQTSELSIA